jgi:type IV pilus assembly protein PilE
MHNSSPIPSGRALRTRGFTLIELIIAMVIGAILVALALPSFMSSLRKSRRSEAMAALTSMQQEQERWRSNNQSYTNLLTDLRVNTPSQPGGYYELGIANNSATGYEVIANGTGSSQANDGDCAKLAVKVDRGAILYAGCKDCADAALSYSASNQCWSR